MQQMLPRLRFAVQNMAGSWGCAIGSRVRGRPWFSKRHQSPAQAQTDVCVLTICQVGNGNRERGADVRGKRRKKKLKVYKKLYDVV